VKLRITVKITGAFKLPKTNRCSFCGRDFPFGTGMMYVRNDGTIYWFCSSKCRKSQIKLGRDSRKFKWARHKGKRKTD